MDIKEIRKLRLKQLINLKFGGVMARLAEAIGRQSSYVARILSDNPDHGRNIGEKLARQIEEACDLPYRYLDAPFDAEFFPDGNGWSVTGATDQNTHAHLDTNTPEAADASLLIPKMDVRMDMSEWEQRPNFDRMISSIGLHKNWIRMNLQVSDPGNLRVITATGNSMEPMIMHGDLLLIDIGVRSFKQDGVYVLGIDGQRMVKRVQKVLDGLRILSDNRIYPEMIIPEGRRDEIEFYGRAVYTWTGTNL
ncbi:S24 family peptidase [Pseudomonas typographi]|uniref:Helix-turn-helix transcriptional regulator n=1 Tax=Pseudomonas typographi TaxID=2715964 RepID=A0ABR7YZR7_9PSED|nr:helix-turn-helix transcriptional regulator [Pseudomonas typographi]MBD1586720.1 helix-turn-helix transcriptional regulator [Pseudomonas typographi]MBD1598614.1 helix-turn-helix transcriptional regulator [Pseudomonas typographi]